MTARKLIGVLALGLLLLVPAVANGAARTTGWHGGADKRYEAGEALVRYAAGVGVTERRDARDAAGVEFEDSLSLPHSQVVSFDGSVKDAIARLEDQPGVVDAQPNYIYHALAAAPNDTFFGNQWGLGGTPGVGVLGAWDRTRGAGQVIAVVDTGVDVTHPDLAGNLVPGHDFVEGDSDPTDLNSHGTHVSGIAAAVAGNGLGVSGVAPEAKIMPIRALDADGKGNTGNIADGIVFAAQNGATVINLSLGGSSGGSDAALTDAIAQAGLRNVVVVSAAGNENNDNDANPTTPCTLDPPTHNNICVAAVTPTGARADYSNFGANTVDVGAPGGDGSGTPAGDIVSLKPGFENLFTEDWQSNTLNAWNLTHPTGHESDPDWGIVTFGSGNRAATDSPPALSQYLPDVDSGLEAKNPINLAGRQGCRFDYIIALDIDDISGDEFFDFATVGLTTGAGELSADWAGNTTNGPGVFGFQRDEILLDPTGVAGRSDVKPFLRFHSDSLTEDDGAYVDNLRVSCRQSSSYPNTIGGDNPSDGGSYMAIAGTSMATPHVAGVAALVRAVDPGAPASQVVDAIKQGAKPDAGMQGVTVTGGVADAVGAMDRALAIPNPVAKPHKPRATNVKVSKKGVITMVVHGDAGNTGSVAMTANITAARVRTVAKKKFKLSSAGRAKVKLKVSKPALKQLKRKHKLKLKVKIVVKNAAGATNSSSGSIRLVFRRR